MKKAAKKLSDAKRLRLARTDPRQLSFFGPLHTQELKNKYGENKMAKTKSVKPNAETITKHVKIARGLPSLIATLSLALSLKKLEFYSVCRQEYPSATLGISPAGSDVRKTAQDAPPDSRRDAGATSLACRTLCDTGRIAAIIFYP